METKRLIKKIRTASLEKGKMYAVVINENLPFEKKDRPSRNNPMLIETFIERLPNDRLIHYVTDERYFKYTKIMTLKEYTDYCRNGELACDEIGTYITWE